MGGANCSIDDFGYRPGDVGGVNCSTDELGSCMGEVDEARTR